MLVSKTRRNFFSFLTVSPPDNCNLKFDDVLYLSAARAERMISHIPDTRILFSSYFLFLKIVACRERGPEVLIDLNFLCWGKSSMLVSVVGAGRDLVTVGSSKVTSTTAPGRSGTSAPSQPGRWWQSSSSAPSLCPLDPDDIRQLNQEARIVRPSRA